MPLHRRRRAAAVKPATADRRNLSRGTQMNDRVHNDDDAARLFRENNDIGSDSSLWLRPLRQLLRDGKPIGQILALTVSAESQLRLPFGMVSRTDNDRLIFWPVLPPRVNMICAGERIDVFDHITLEFPSEKIHVTAYDSNGQRVHRSRAWRTHHLQDPRFTLWFLLLVRMSVLQRQDMAVQRRVKTPVKDKKRRTDEFAAYVRRLKLLNVPLPAHTAEQDYIYFGFYLAPGSPMTSRQLSAPILPAGTSMDAQIEGWHSGNVFEITGLRFALGKRTVCVAAACPPGRCLSDVFVGFPRRDSEREQESKDARKGGDRSQ